MDAPFQYPSPGTHALSTSRPQERSDWQLTGAGFGIHWPAIDDYLSVEGLLRGSPSLLPQALRELRLPELASRLEFEAGINTVFSGRHLYDGPS